jgi:hypothetical protein
MIKDKSCKLKDKSRKEKGEEKGKVEVRKEFSKMGNGVE